MGDQLYLQDSRSHAYVGDGLSFWGFGESGYERAGQAPLTKTYLRRSS